MWVGKGLSRRCHLDRPRCSKAKLIIGVRSCRRYPLIHHHQHCLLVVKLKLVKMTHLQRYPSIHCLKPQAINQPIKLVRKNRLSLRYHQDYSFHLMIRFIAAIKVSYHHRVSYPNRSIHHYSTIVQQVIE